MARDIPEYKRSQGIIPAAEPQGFDAALKETGASSRIIGELGSQLSKSASLEQSRQAGFEAGLTPGRTLLPAFTENDKEFIKTYREQEYNIAANNASLAIQRFAFEAQKIPSAKSLANFNAQLNEYEQNNVGLLTKETARELKPKLDALRLSVNLDVEKAMFEKGQTFQKENLKGSIERTSKDVGDLLANGLYEQAFADKERAKNTLDTPWAASTWPEETRKALKKEIDTSYYRDVAKNQMSDAVKVPGAAEELLTDAAKLPPTHENITKQESYLATYNNYRALTKAHDQVKISEATQDLENGTWTPVKMIALKSEVSAPAYAQFELAVDRHLRKSKEDEATYAYMLNNSKDAIALANLTSDELNGGFAQMLKRGALAQGSPLTFEQEAHTAQQIEAAIPSFNKKLSAGINSNNPEMAAKSAQIYAAMFDKNPLAVSGVDAKSKAKADVIAAQLGGNASPLEAVKFATDKIDNLSPKDIQARQELFKAQLKDNDKNNPIDQEKWVRKATGFGSKQMPPGVVNDFMASMQRHYMISGDWGIAEKNASLDIKGAYGEDHGRVMYLPPSLSWPGGDNTTFVNNLAISQLERLFSDQRIAYDNNNALSYFEFPDKAIKAPGNILYDSRLQGIATPGGGIPGRQIPAVMVSDNGRVKGHVIYNSDVETVKDGSQPPSYSFLFVPNDKSKPIPIYNQEHGQARFVFGAKESKAYQDTIDKEKSRKGSEQKAADALANKIAEVRELHGDTNAQDY